jgi:hypothetical protein
MEDDRFKQRCEMWSNKLMVEVAAGRVENRWDEDFIASVRKQVKSGKTLTQKQHDKLEELFEKY